MWRNNWRVRLLCSAAVISLCAIMAMPGSAYAVYDSFLKIEIDKDEFIPGEFVSKSKTEENYMISGETMDQWHKDEIQILSWSFGANIPIGSGHAARTGVTDKTPERLFRFTMKVNRASPGLFLRCAKGRQIKKVTLSVRKAGAGEGQDYLVITLGNVSVSSFETTGGTKGADDRPIDDVSLSFRTIKIVYKQSKPNGTLGDETTIDHNFGVTATKPRRAAP